MMSLRTHVARQVSATFKRSMHASTTCKAVTLPYAKNALEPIMCEETLDIHHGRHHAAYVNNLNGQIKDTDMDNMDIVEIMMKSWNNGSPAATFNNAAQVVEQ